MIRLAAAVALLFLSTSAVACDTSSPASTTGAQGGATRGFALGLSSLPAELTDAGYDDAFELAGDSGEVVLIKRVPPWGELLAEDGFPSDELVAATRRETELAREHKLELFVAIDPTGGRTGPGDLADLPAGMEGAGFGDARVREAFLRYTRYVAANYKPLFLALGVEVNSYAAANPEDFGNFVSLYAEAYDAVKALSPDSVVFPTFQLEEMHGLLPPGGARSPQWNVITQFDPRIDLIALSTYPHLVFSDPARIPQEYLSRAQRYADAPVAIAEMGYSSAAGAGEADGEQSQTIFLDRMLSDAERLEMPLAVWFVGQDPTYSGAPPFDQLSGLGLLRTDASEKAAWQSWREASDKALAEESGTQDATGQQ
jgi:hypothetical protein